MPIVLAVLIGAVIITGQLSPDSDLDEADGRPQSVVKLRKDMENSIARSRYGEAAKLAESNLELCTSDDYFAEVMDEIQNHFTDVARNYYKGATTYSIEVYCSGKNFEPDTEGYNAAEGTLDPYVIEDKLTDDDKVVLDRTRIECTPDNKKYECEFKVYIDICGMTIVYPADDIRI
ncbi:MAG: hypothetical protein ACI4JJ_07335 [Huintestinicola sp.]